MSNTPNNWEVALLPIDNDKDANPLNRSSSNSNVEIKTIFTNANNDSCSKMNHVFLRIGLFELVEIKIYLRHKSMPQILLLQKNFFIMGILLNTKKHISARRKPN